MAGGAAVAGVGRGPRHVHGLDRRRHNAGQIPRACRTMITVHHLENSRSQRVLWLLEELGLPYDIVQYKRDPKTELAPDTLREVHPLGKSPVLTEGKVTVAESGAIIDYLIERHGNGRLVPAANSPDMLRYRYWLHFAEGSAMPPLLMVLVFDRIRSAPMPFFVKPIARGIADKVMSSFVTPNLERQLDFMEAELRRSAWFAGNEFTAADVQMSFPLEAAAQRAGLNSSRPKLMAYLGRIHARPAYRKALERGGPYSFAQ
jgi:glutathione S-transferase